MKNKIIIMLMFFLFRLFWLVDICHAGVTVKDLYPASKVYNASTKTWKIPAVIRAASNIATSERTVALSMDLTKAANLGALVGAAGVAYLASEYVDWLMQDKPANWTVPTSGAGNVTKSVTNVIPPSNYGGYGLPPAQYIGNYASESLAKDALVTAGYNLCAATQGCTCWWTIGMIDSIYLSNPKIYRGSKCTAPQVMFYATAMATPNTETVVSDVTQNELDDLFDTKLAASSSASDPVVKATGSAINTASSLYPSGANSEGKPSLTSATPATVAAAKALLDSMIASGDATIVQNEADAMTEEDYVAAVRVAQQSGLDLGQLQDALKAQNISADKIAAAVRAANPSATASEIATAIRANNPSATASEIATALRANPTVTPAEIATALRANPAVTASEIATALRANPAVTASEIATALRANPAVTASEIATAIRANNPAATAAEISAAIASSGLTANGIATAVRANNPAATAAEIATAIRANNPAATAAEIGAAVRAANPAATAAEIGAAIQSLGLTANDIASAVRAANPAATAAEIAAAITAANPAATKAEIQAATKTAIEEAGGSETVPTEGTITMPTKLSLTGVLQTFMNSINALPMMETLNGLSVVASGSSNLCLALPSNLGGTKCYDLANMQGTFDIVGNCLLGLTTLFSFMYVFKG